MGWETIWSITTSDSKVCVVLMNLSAVLVLIVGIICFKRDQRCVKVYRHLHRSLLLGLCIGEIVAKVKVTGSELVTGSEFPCIQNIYKHGTKMTWTTVGSSLSTVRLLLPLTYSTC